VTSDLTGRGAVVTGAASGIGRGLCLELAARGARVVAADVEAAPLAETVRLVEQQGGTAIGHVTDVTDPATVQALADRAFAALGAVHLLFNNAGVFTGGWTWETSDADWAWVLAVNVRGVMNGIRAFVPRMIAQRSDGHVVNTASMAGIVSAPLSAPYCASKFAVVGLSECLWHDLSMQPENRLGVSVVVPSAVATAIGTSERTRPAALASPVTEGGRSVGEALVAATASGLDPMAAARRILDGVAAGEFYIPTTDRFAEHCALANETRLRQAPPRFEMF
jgi:NAD(P)-dependent dehydrogenase (short-subunit alcohol dehydrogenase family)